MTNLREKLLPLSDLKYKEFHSKLVPTADRKKMIGIPLPVLRTMAREIAKSNTDEFTNITSLDYYEEKMLFGLVIGYKNMPFDERIKSLDEFVPLIDNWAICDCVCSTLKFTKKHLEQMYLYIQKHLKIGSEYHVRFAVVMLMDYFINDEYIDRVLETLDKIKSKEYYVEMASAWAISVAFVKYQDKTMNYLKNNSLDDFTYNKALQKIIESNRVDKETKDIIRSMKRK